MSLSHIMPTLIITALIAQTRPAQASASDAAASFVDAVASKVLGFGVDSLLSAIFGGGDSDDIVTLSEESMDAIADLVGEEISAAFRSDYLDQAEYALGKIDDYKDYESTAFMDARGIVDELQLAKAFLNNGDMFTVQAYMLLSAAELAFRDELWRLKALDGAGAAVLEDYRADLAREASEDLTYLEHMGDWIRLWAASTIQWRWVRTVTISSSLYRVKLCAGSLCSSESIIVVNGSYILANGSNTRLSSDPAQAAASFSALNGTLEQARIIAADEILGDNFDFYLTDLKSLVVKYTADDGRCTVDEFFASNNISGSDCDGALSIVSPWNVIVMTHEMMLQIFIDLGLYEIISIQRAQLENAEDAFNEAVIDL